MLVPRPFSYYHDSYMRSFARTGQGVFIGNTRSVLGLDGSGYLVPLVINIREVPPQPDDPKACPQLSAVLNKPVCEDGFILFESENLHHKLLHFDAASASRLLGLSPEQLDESDYYVGDIIPELRVHEDDDNTSSPTEATDSNYQKTNTANKAQDFMQYAQASEEHVTITTRNPADKRLKKILGRIQKIVVPRHGDVYLLTWKASDRKEGKRTSKKHAGTSTIAAAPTGCPFSSTASARETTHQSSQQSHNTATECPDNRTAASHATDGGSLGGWNAQHAPEGQEEIQCEDRHSQNQHSERRGLRADSHANSSTNSSGSVRRLLHYVIANEITGVKAVTNKVRLTIAISVIVFVLYAVLGWIGIQSTSREAIQAVKSIRASNVEVTSYSATLSALFYAHIPNSQFPSVVKTKGAMWSALKQRIKDFLSHSEQARSYVQTIGGSAQQWELEEQHKVFNRFTKTTEKLSVHEMRDFIAAHLRQLESQSNASSFIPGEEPHHVKLLFDNSQATLSAFNESRIQRLSQLHTLAEDYLQFLETTIFAVSGVTIAVFCSLLCYWAIQLHNKNQELLKIFLLIPLSTVKSLRSKASRSLERHLERTGNTDLIDDTEEDVPHEDHEGRENTPVSVDEQENKHIPGATKRRSHSKNQEMRIFKSSKKFLITSALKLVSPLSLFIIWGSSVYGNMRDTFNTLEQEAKRVNLMELSISGWLQFQQQIGLLTLRAPYPDLDLGAAPFQQLVSYRRQALLFRDISLERTVELLEGEENQLPKLPRSRHSHELWTEYGCTVHTDPMESLCKETPLAHGLRAYIRDFLNRGLAVMSKLPPLSMDGNDAMERLQADSDLQREFRSFNNALFPLASKAGRAFSNLSVQASRDSVARALQELEVITVIYVLAFTVAGLILTVPSADRLGHSLNSAFYLLALIPEELLADQPNLKSQVRYVTERLASQENSKDSTLLLASRAKNDP
eukprot:gb/GECG01012928.1/.p1 GENE.gb/GECG01012928.1/~~gb/GECG01012928.1/.p1  ORF type:complete len:967 (+),score=103.85 gb/GECG01012928.1/:1-2901(+)